MFYTFLCKPISGQDIVLQLRLGFSIIELNNNSMTVMLGKNPTKKEAEDAIEKLRKRKKKINLDKYFGKVDFQIDGLKYQKKARNEWD